MSSEISTDIRCATNVSDFTAILQHYFRLPAPAACQRYRSTLNPATETPAKIILDATQAYARAQLHDKTPEFRLIHAPVSIVLEAATSIDNQPAGKPQTRRDRLINTLEEYPDLHTTLLVVKHDPDCRVMPNSPVHNAFEAAGMLPLGQCETLFRDETGPFLFATGNAIVVVCLSEQAEPVSQRLSSFIALRKDCDPWPVFGGNSACPSFQTTAADKPVHISAIRFSPQADITIAAINIAAHLDAPPQPFSCN